MEIYDSLLGAVCDEYDRVTLIKKSERGEVTLIRHRASGNRYIFRHFSGSSEVYRKLFFEKGIPIELLPKKKPLFSITFLEKVLSGISVPGTKFQMHRYSEDGL